MINVREEKILIDTYPEAKQEDLPMFAENRVHQRTSGNPYPNKVVQVAQRKVRIKKEYICIILENDFLEIGILPDLGGKIWYAKDKKNGYEFFYKNNVIKPALIGVLGSWTSGGLEFNWPFHHRASTFMPVDYEIEQGTNYAIVWLSEHDPINRMKGMVGISLKEGECIFETKVKVDNITPFRHSFLWWENAAVPVDESYEIFFPKDVNYVRFHYKRSVTTYPIANNDRFGAFNGIYYDGDTDISKHKNTRQATSYFSAESKYDYFGGYNNNKEAGVVHIADHHVSPGKKMFTWAYSQLAKTWENALTDNDGQYAELMAGCYSDNQPDLTWLMPNETKTFSQKWFPIHENGIPAYANENGALFINEKNRLTLQSVRSVKNATVYVYDGEEKILEKTIDIPCYQTLEVATNFRKNMRVEIREKNTTLVSYTFCNEIPAEIPEPRKELPYFKEVKTARELYLEGLHVEQYRSPEYSAEQCYLEALKRDEEYGPAAIALSELYLKKTDAKQALYYAELAEKAETKFNIRLESGKIYYLKGLALCALERLEEGYAYLYKAAWCYDYKSAAMLRIGLLDLRNGEYGKAIEHFRESLQGNGESVLVNAFLGYAYYRNGQTDEAEQQWNRSLEKDRLNLFTKALKCLFENEVEDFCMFLKTDLTQVTLDLAEVFAEAGMYEELRLWLEEVEKIQPLNAMPKYCYSMLSEKKIEKADVGIAYPSRDFEKKVLEKALKANPDDLDAEYLLGCLLYGKGLFEEGMARFEKVLSQKEDYRAYRNLAAGYYSHKNDKKTALKLIKKAAALAPIDEKQITFETVYVMAKTGADPKEIEDFILARDYDRDDVTVELARAYNHQNKPDQALQVLLERNFVACEGGEHYIADEYMYAYYLKGKKAFEERNYEQAVACFEKAQNLPQSLGSGLWNDIKKVPYQYFQAKTLERLGKEKEANAIYRSFEKYKFDYFTDMYLYTFAYYLAKGLEAQGKMEQANALILKRKAEFENAFNQETLGYFGTTPFFISFIDEARSARELHYAYPLYLFNLFLKEEKAKNYKEIFVQDGYGLYIEDFTLDSKV